MFYLLMDLLGTAAFAISGVMVAMDKRLDLFGVFIVAFVTAVGGGTLRDLLIGNTPVVWMREYIYIVTIISTVVLSILFREKLRFLRKSLFLFDTLGIGLYTMVGIEQGLQADLLPIMCIALGTMTASFGGVIRDILCNEIPVVFHKEIYATACVVGGISYFVLRNLPIQDQYVYIMAISIVVGIRLMAVKYKIALPSIYKTD
ncbi:trimeric intracellular cation channel family protein [Eudoraea chungangensis]|uniref:trimeric intracellular cation channel family protein n=1 Tax=Eudoraea chungangensis TaxID=1481905 RepID=UPI0023EC3171|nr:trimeric intracellular cation channel family protein [Eudoraea chungangensis]